MATIIQDILSKGKSINDELSKKIELLNQRNSNFNQELTKKLNDIISAISAFKSTNLEGLTETKNKLTAVTDELETTKENLQQTQNELNRVKTDLDNVQNNLQNTNAIKNDLEQKVRELDEKIKQTDLEYQNQINAVRREMSQKFTEDKKALEKQHDEDITQLNNEKTTLQKGIEEAERAQTQAINDLNALQKEQGDLITNLGTINAFLTRQLELITSINTEQPNGTDYTTLLETIQNGLTGVIGEINQAVATNTTTAVATNTTTPLYDKFVKLSKEQQDEIFSMIGQKYAQQIMKDIKLPTSINKTNIQNILRRYYQGDLLRGGRRKRKTIKKRHIRTRKTMKKRHRRTRKKMTGGYVYSSSNKLDKASSVISESFDSKSKSISKTRRSKHKTGR